MTVCSWRIVKTKHAGDAFNGEGARIHGGRWNSPGRRVVYTAESVALALLETMVHSDPVLLPYYTLISARFEESEIHRVGVDELPKEWQAFPAPHELKMIGDDWHESRSSLVLQVPSAVVPHEMVFLLNPEHPRFSEIAIGSPIPFEVDLRLR